MNLSKNENELNVEPGIGVLAMFPKLKYKKWFALSEYVDNSIQSFLSKKKEKCPYFLEQKEVNVYITIDTQDKDGKETTNITIKDDAGGIELEDFPRAFRPAEVPTDASGLSEFGMGMKTASLWFTPNWICKTKVAGELIEREVRWSLNEILSKNSDGSYANKKPKIMMHNLPDSDKNKHYTHIELLDVVQPIGKGKSVSAIKKHMSSIFQRFILNGDLKLYIDGELQGFEKPRILEVPKYGKDYQPQGDPIKWERTIHIESNGKKISGTVYLMQEGSYDLGGLVLFRRNRVYVGSGSDPFRPRFFGKGNTYKNLRMRGELDLEGFRITHTKDAFDAAEVDDPIWNKLELKLKDEPNFLTQCSNYRTPSENLVSSELGSDDSLKDPLKLITEIVEEQKAGMLDKNNLIPDVESLSESSNIFQGEILREEKIKLQDNFSDFEITVREYIPDIDDPMNLINFNFFPGSTEERDKLFINIPISHPFILKYQGPEGEAKTLIYSFISAISISYMKSLEMVPKEGEENLNVLISLVNYYLLEVMSKNAN